MSGVAEPKVVKTLCRLCEPGCGIRAHVHQGKLVKVEGLPEHPTSRGALCPKGEAAVQIVHSPERLTQPLLRVGARGGGRFEKVSWKRALEFLVERLDRLREEHGAESLALFRGQAADWGAPWQYALRFMFAFGSPNTTTPSHICYFPRVAAENLTYGCFVEPDYDRAKTIVEWGACRADTHLPAWLRIKQAQEQGAKLVVVDPVRSKMVERADLWLRPRPGTDGALALSLMQVLIEEALYDREFVENWTVGFDRLAKLVERYPPRRAAETTWVPAEMIREAARMMATGGATAIYAGNGLEHHTNTFQTLRAIACLRAVAGTVDRPGGNRFLTLVKWLHLEGDELISAEQKSRRVGQYNLFTDMSYCVPFPAIADAILTGDPYPIRGLLVIGGNPAVTMPNHRRVDEALRKLELLVVLDPLLTRTARLADLVLPAATQFEKTGLIASTVWGEYGDYALLKQKAVEVEGCWPDWKILFELARRLGFGDAFPWKDVEEAIDYQLEPSGITVEQLKAHPGGVRFKEGERYRKYEQEGFGTSSGKVELYSQALQEQGQDPLPGWTEPAESPVSQPELAKEYPLIGCSAGKTVNYVHSQYRHVEALREREPEPWVRIHPEDAGSRGIVDGEWVGISSPRGSIRMKAEVTDTTLPGVVSISPHWGESFPEAHMNVLIDDGPRDPVTGSTSDRSFLCEVANI
jgi:anaerobic selenocysteine-containing dehydrogenase